ncbi:PHP domain-containing protein [Clostridium sp.]|uniref:PHP domain-containing protein n=1 Tax=Clostridium sp. TaxID=1506 RepID=UPI002FC90633
MFLKGDFHIHSTASDGRLTPFEVVQFAKKQGVDIIALTDHNTMSGVKEALLAGEKYGVAVIPGVELSTRYKGNRVHILGYFNGNRYKDDFFQKILRLIKTRKTKQVQRLLRDSIEITLDSGKLSVESGITLLKHFGATVVLAHPVTINRRYVMDVISMPFHGIEAKYFRNTRDDTRNFLKICKEKGCFYTAGSDFHTNKQMDLKHGLIGDAFLDSEEIDIFLKESSLNILLKLTASQVV